MAGASGGGLRSDLPLPRRPAGCAHLLEVGTTVQTLGCMSMFLMQYHDNDTCLLAVCWGFSPGNRLVNGCWLGTAEIQKQASCHPSTLAGNAGASGSVWFMFQRDEPNKQ